MISTYLVIALEVAQAQWCPTIPSCTVCQSVSLWGPYKPFPFSVGQVVGWERKKLLGYLAAVRYQTTILGFYTTKLSIQDIQACIHMQTLFNVQGHHVFPVGLSDTWRHKYQGILGSLSSSQCWNTVWEIGWIWEAGKYLMNHFESFELNMAYAIWKKMHLSKGFQVLHTEHCPSTLYLSAVLQKHT